MVRKLSEDVIVSDLGEALSHRLITACIRDLQRVKDCLSGEYSGLKNAWDEICVQEQSDRSCHWDAYLDTINCFIEIRVANLKPYELDAIWLLTYEHSDWKHEQQDERQFYPVSTTDIINYIQDRLLGKAIGWSNPQVSKYLEQDYDW